MVDGEPLAHRSDWFDRDGYATGCVLIPQHDIAPKLISDREVIAQCQTAVSRD